MKSSDIVTLPSGEKVRYGALSPAEKRLVRNLAHRQPSELKSNLPHGLFLDPVTFDYVQNQM